MTDKAETMTCGECKGRGWNPGDCHPKETCGVCHGTGLSTTGAVVGVLEPNPLAPALDAMKVERDQFSLALKVATEKRDHDHAEIERLKREIAIDESGYKGEIATLKVEREKARADVRRLKEDERGLLADNAALTADRDVLRLEVQRLKDLNHESQDLYAAIEAERDELKNTLCEAVKEIAHMRESNGRADDYSAKLERVIEALRYELAGVMHCHAATIRSIVRLANAGLELPEVPDNA